MRFFLIWASLGHTPTPEPLTIAGGMECYDWFSLGLMLTSGDFPEHEAPNRNWELRERRMGSNRC